MKNLHKDRFFAGIGHEGVGCIYEDPRDDDGGLRWEVGVRSHLLEFLSLATDSIDYFLYRS